MTLFDPEPAAPSGPLVRVRATVAYDGSGFSGFAPQPGRRPTVAGELAGALARVLGHQVAITCAGRTDAGVHARGQVISFDAAAERFDVARLQRSLNKALNPRIAVSELAVAAPDFDARFSARSRRYRYQLLNGPVLDPLLAATTWWVEAPLDLARLRLACDPLLGEHDFSSFCRRPDGEEVSLVRTVLDARWDCRPAEGGAGSLLHFWIEANAFCHQMVRAIVGTLVDIGRGKRHAGELSGIIRATDRAAAGPVAPAHGLCLWAVTY